MEQTKFTLQEFQRWAMLTENAESNFELIHGEVIEVSPGRTSHSELEHLIAFAVRLFCRDTDLLCHTSGGDGAYAIHGHVVAPDFAYKHTPTSDLYPDPEPPLWAVEIISPNDKAKDIREKREIYRKAGILYWEMYPQSYSVDVYAPGQPVRTLGIDDTLDGGDVLPGFTLPLRDLLTQQ